MKNIDNRPKILKGRYSDADTNYINLVSKAGLFGKAFFGHKRTKAESKKLNDLWKKAQSMAEKGQVD